MKRRIDIRQLGRCVVRDILIVSSWPLVTDELTASFVPLRRHSGDTEWSGLMIIMIVCMLYGRVLSTVDW